MKVYIALWMAGAVFLGSARAEENAAQLSNTAKQIAETLDVYLDYEHHIGTGVVLPSKDAIRTSLLNLIPSLNGPEYRKVTDRMVQTYFMEPSARPAIDALLKELETKLKGELPKQVSRQTWATVRDVAAIALAMVAIHKVAHSQQAWAKAFRGKAASAGEKVSRGYGAFLEAAELRTPGALKKGFWIIQSPQKMFAGLWNLTTALPIWAGKSSARVLKAVSQRTVTTGLALAGADLAVRYALFEERPSPSGLLEGAKARVLMDVRDRVEAARAAIASPSTSDSTDAASSLTEDANLDRLRESPLSVDLDRPQFASTQEARDYLARLDQELNELDPGASEVLNLGREEVKKAIERVRASL